MSRCAGTGVGTPTGCRAGTIMPAWSGGGPIGASALPWPCADSIGLSWGCPGVVPLAVLEKLAFGCIITDEDSKKSFW